MKFHHIRPNKNKKRHFGHFRLFERYTYLRTPIVNPFLWSLWGINQLYTTGGSRDIENHTIFSLQDPKKTWNCIFRALQVVWRVYIPAKTHSRPSIVVILRSQPTFHTSSLREKDFKTAAVSEFAIIGWSPPSSTGLKQRRQV